MENIYLLKAGSGDMRTEYKLLSKLKGENGFENKYYRISYRKYKNKVLKELMDSDKGIGLRANRVPQTYFFLYKDNVAIGIFKVRHYLTEELLHGAGHIGYAIFKKYRNKGYAKAGLKLAIEELKKMEDFKDEFIVMGCMIKNTASLKVQESVGAKIKEVKDNHYITHTSIYV